MIVKPWNILVGCEYSGIVRRALAARGHDVWSVDLLPSLDGSNRHIIGDVRDYLDEGWDFLAVFHPPCTRLCNSGVRWLHEPPGQLGSQYPEHIRIAYRGWSRKQRLDFMWHELEVGADLFSKCWNAPVPRVCAENPIMHEHARKLIANYEAPQFIQPWHHGEPQFKATGLHIRGLKKLLPSNILVPPKPGTKLHKEWSKVHRAARSADRWKVRSEFFPGVATAMAEQWTPDCREAA